MERLDFVAEGVQFFEQLQDVTCPLCDQVMTGDHAHIADERGTAIYDAAKAEAAKILAQRADLGAAIADLEGRKNAHLSNAKTLEGTLERLEAELRSDLAPRLRGDVERLEQLSDRRLQLETVRNDFDQYESLLSLRQQIEDAASDNRPKSREWEPLPAAALLALCRQVESVLKEWRWKSAEPRVEFDQRTYDIIVDGQARQSHGKGVRALLYSAFVVGLLRYCSAHNRPHPGFVVIDSPLTSYKRASDATVVDGVDAGLEAGLWIGVEKGPR